VRPAHGVALTAVQDPPESHLVADHAVHDTQICKTAERLQAWPPDVPSLISSRQIAGHPAARPS
jgi:hypothetical protein